jgi:hypothetical protein
LPNRYLITKFRVLRLYIEGQGFFGDGSWDSELGWV